MVRAVITLLLAASIVLIARRFMTNNMASTPGLITGIHTQPSALSFASGLTSSESPNLSYVAVHPVALITRIVPSQVLVGS